MRPDKGLELLLLLANYACLATVIIHEICLAGMSYFAEITGEMALERPATTEPFVISGDAHVGFDADVLCWKLVSREDNILVDGVLLVTCWSCDTTGVD